MDCRLAVLVGFLWVSVGGAAERIPRHVGKWPAELGNHRAVVHVEAKVPAVRIHLPWRRPDLHPEKMAITVIDAATGNRVDNSVAVRVDRSAADLVFQPTTAPGDYYMYYLPVRRVKTGSEQDSVYAAPKATADASWRVQAGVAEQDLPGDAWRKLPAARVVEFQAISPLDQFTEMEQIATPTETERLLSEHTEAKYLLFPEDRRHPIRLTDDLPHRWIELGPRQVFQGKAARGEFYAWQVGVFAVAGPIEDVEVAFDGLRPSSGGDREIPDSALRCWCKGGIDWQGKRFARTFAVGQGKVRAMWFGVQVPVDMPAGSYRGMLTIAPKGMPASRIAVRLEVGEETLEDAGDGEPWRHSRLRWLDSTIASDDEPTRPFTPLQVEETTIRCLGREVTLGPAGLPEQIRSYFAPEVTHMVDRPRELLASPIRFVVQTPEASTAFSGGPLQFVRRTPGVVQWRSESTAGKLRLRCDARMEFDGYLECQLQLTTLEPTEVSDLRLEIPFRRDAARFMMGMGRPGGLRPAEHRWKWDRAKHQDRLWVGDVNVGLQCRLFGEDYRRPLVSLYYRHRPLNLPPAWYNAGKGGCRLAEEGDDRVVLRATSGPRTVEPGQTLHFHFALLPTPLKPLDTDSHWRIRYWHNYRWPNRPDDDLNRVTTAGANVLNIHQGNWLNPYINYPFLSADALRTFIARAHQDGVNVKIYYTVRELSNHATELWALRSLGDEILAHGRGGGAAWLREHLRDDYIAAWYDAPVRDASIVTAGMSRWHNYYLEGLDWLARNVKIDGLYLDDVAYDRSVMQRVRRILDRRRPDARIDLHSWNHFDRRAGYACCANLYMEQMPYIDRIWFGESRNYNTPPDYWMVEISGIPFGLMGEMLAGGGNPWRGMVYGMTNRLGWGGDPRPIWKIWDQFGMQDSRMVGYWVPDCPVKTDRKNVLATVYKRPGKALVALASWAPEKTGCRLEINYKALGLEATGMRLRAPEIEKFQPAATFRPDETIPLEPGHGWLLILEKPAG